LLSAYAVASLAEVAQAPVIGFLGNVLRAMSPADLLTVATKLLMIGMLVALASAVTGLSPGGREGLVSVLARTFTRGVTSILVVTIVLSVVL
jgi:hypothetical protein